MPSQFKRFSKDNLPALYHFADYRKVITTKAIRIEGPFICYTIHGATTCEDGWLAIDSQGFPYPIANSEFVRSYEPVGS